MTDELRDKIRAALMDYHCTHQREGGQHEEQPLPLVDVLSQGYPTIKQGTEEIDLLADHLAVALEPVAEGGDRNG